MGIDYNGAKFLFYAKSLGVKFDRTAMLGRQTLNLTPKDLHKISKKFSMPIPPEQLNTIFNKYSGFSESLFHFLGAENIDSFDNSSYENATHIHDMNTPIPAEYKSSYSSIIDGGTLEHIFNFPIAIQNCMEMLSVGGHFLSITNGNNFMGHGFYQFSPELFFRIFNPQNGFEIIDLIMFEDTLFPTWYSINDPDIIKKRITLINRIPTYILVIAKKIEQKKIFSTSPQQSDYSIKWNNAIQIDRYKKFKTAIRKKLNNIPVTCLRRLSEIFAPTFQKDFYKSKRKL